MKIPNNKTKTIKPSATTGPGVRTVGATSVDPEALRRAKLEEFRKRVAAPADSSDAQAPQMSPTPKTAEAPGPGTNGAVPGKRPVPSPQNNPEGAAPPAPVEPVRIAFLPWHGELPDDADALMKIIAAPESVGHAVAAVRKFGQVNGQDVVANMMEWPPQEFGPIVQSMAVVGKPDIMGHFAAYAVPVRRALAERYQPLTPEVGMLLDILVLAYFRFVHIERLTSICLDGALSTMDGLEKALQLQRLADQTLKQIHRTLETLRMLTGIGDVTETEEEISATLQLRKRRTTHGQRRSGASRG